MIDVIIPAYNAHDTIERTLFSIAYQENVKDLNVYIINDASKSDYSKEIGFFENFINIKEVKLDKNVGPGVARQIGIDQSNSEYIVFIDSDDVFSSPFALKVLYENIQRTNADVIISSFYEELEDGTKIEHIDDSIWLHGKIYRREFLDKNKIRFNNTYANEDNGFNQLIFLHDSNIVNIDDFTYIWTFNKKSITRMNNYEYSFEGLEGYLYNMTWALDSAIKDECNDYKIASLAFSTLIATYYYYIEFKDNVNKDYLIKWAKRIYEISEEYPLQAEEEKINIWNHHFLFSTDNIEFKHKLNPPIAFEKFLEMIQNYNSINENNKMIIAMSCTKSWYNHLVVGLYSLLENNKSIYKIYLLVETEKEKDIKYLSMLKHKYNVEFVLINANNYFEKYIKEESPNFNSFFTNFALGKLMLSDFVEEDKVIYLDTDTLVVKDISNVWRYDISNYYVAGVKDFGIYKRGNIDELGINGKYINSGFLIFNLKKIRKDKIQKKWFNIINDQELLFPDQDALNIVCTNKELYLPSMYNICDDVTLELENKSLAKVYHYAGIKENWVVNLRYAEEWYNVEEKFYNCLILGEK